MTKEDRGSARVQEVTMYEPEVLITLRLQASSIDDGLTELAMWLSGPCAKCPRRRVSSMM